jgi:hypothetical protein
MFSTTKPQAILMAMAAHNPAFAKKRGISQGVAREFNQADKGSGILKRAAGGATPMEMGMDAQMNNGQGHGHNFFSTTPLMGHAMSGMQLGRADGAIRNAQSTLARFRFAEGGKVKPAGPSARERKQIRDLIERGKDDAVTTLRAGRAALLEASPDPADTEDYTASLDRLRKSLASPVEMADGEVDADAGVTADPQMLYGEYTELLAQLSDTGLDEQTRSEIADRLAQIEQQFDAPEAPGFADGGVVEMRPIERRTIIDKILGKYGDALTWAGKGASRLAKLGGQTPLGELYANALRSTGEGLEESGHAFHDWSAGFSPIHSTGNVTQPAVDREQLAAILGGLPPVAEVAGAVPGAVRHAARDFVEGQVRGLPRITAYHGSPHAFETFDTSKIGTGQGHHSYGHGLYFAENPEVAAAYKKTGPAGKESPGHVYTVDIPDEHVGKMLDWDKPLSEQSTEVKKALEALPEHAKQLANDTLEEFEMNGIDWDNLHSETDYNGRYLYTALARNASQEEASELLRTAGLRGIRYLDKKSRGAGEGTRNLVVFDDAIPKILKRDTGEVP